MKLRKVINRVHRGTTYYRWVLNIPPKEIRALGWVDGQKLEAVPQGFTLSLRPARPSPPVLARPPFGALVDAAQERSARGGRVAAHPEDRELPRPRR